MLTARFRSGYIAGSLAPGLAGRTILAAMPVPLVALVLPDVDMIWFHAIDHGSIHHHPYWTHIQAFWLALALPTVALTWNSRWRWAVGLFFAVILLHLLLDSIGGDIMWAAPFSDRFFSLVTVPATRGHWALSFMLHWTFAFELAIWLWAFVLWQRRGS
ncbi:metal-dependent hydrolase [Paracoccus sp. p4-l81]|uniref:metal-dependent hydrolase n=1 Tax=unclassified Paracoccus (in: a-proteobacteria) TaxID=2688777 RepID=UPI0035B6EB7A